MSLLDVEDVEIRFPTDEGTVHAVNGASLSISPGEILGIVGESGSGKTVLAKALLGIVDTPGRIAAGSIRWNGTRIDELSEEALQSIRGGEISIVFQDPSSGLNPAITVGEQIAEPLRIHRDLGESTTLPAEMKRKILGTTDNSKAWKQSIEMLETVGIPAPGIRANDHPHEFSVGMRQRAMIAMALAGEPDLLIADEPTTALDVTTQAAILDELGRLQEVFETAILLITHNLPVVAEFCDRVNIMYAGEIVERAATDELFANPQHPYTQGLLASTPRIDRPEDALEPIPGEVPNLMDPPAGCSFAPRCPDATEECNTIDPEQSDVGELESHTAACIHRGEQ